MTETVEDRLMRELVRHLLSLPDKEEPKPQPKPQEAA